MPWVEMKCTGVSVGTQTGLQIIYGGESTPREFQAMAREERAKMHNKKAHVTTEVSLLILICALATLGALASSVFGYVSEDRIPKYLTAAFCGIAILAITTQMALGFPIEKALVRTVQTMDKGDFSVGPVGGGSRAEFGSMFRIDYAMGLWLELMALSIPLIVAANKLLDDTKTRNSDRAKGV